jgi:hypothetical protein
MNKFSSRKKIFDDQQNDLIFHLNRHEDLFLQSKQLVRSQIDDNKVRTST